MSDEHLKKRMSRSVKDTAAKFLDLHGYIWRRGDAGSLAAYPTEKDGLKAIEIELTNQGCPPGKYRSEAREKVAAKIYAPANNPHVCSVSNWGRNINADTGELVSGTAFLDKVVELTKKGIKIRERNEDEIFWNAIPHKLPTKHTEDTYEWDLFITSFGIDAVEANHTDDLRRLIMGMIGACIFDNRMQKFFDLNGDGGSGKGVLMKVITAAVGIENVGVLKSTRAGGRFEAGFLHGKRVILLNEMKKRPTSEHAESIYDDFLADIKASTGMDLVPMETKFKEAIKLGQQDAPYIAASNTGHTLAQVDERAGAWARRYVPIPCPPTLDERFRDDTLPDVLIANDLQGIMYEAMHTFAEIYSDNEWPSLPEVELVAEQAARSELEPFLEFIVAAPNAQLYYSELKAGYCVAMGMNSVASVDRGAMRKITKAVNTRYGAESGKNPALAPISGIPDRFMRGIKWRDGGVQSAVDERLKLDYGAK